MRTLRFHAAPLSPGAAGAFRATHMIDKLLCPSGLQGWRRLARNDTHDELEPEVFLDRPVERLAVADPDRIQRRIRSKFRRGRLARKRAARMRGGNDEALV